MECDDHDEEDGETISCFVVIHNIPSDYHSADLRNYFSQFIESGGFGCFHFRHRPEKIQSSSDQQKSKSDLSVSLSHADFCVRTSKKTSEKCTFCCVVRLNGDKANELIKMYHKKHWLDRKGESIPQLCLITKTFVKLNYTQDNQAIQEDGSVYRTREEQKQIDPTRETFSRADLEKLTELHPPDIMPNGNVGTPTMVFLQFIKECRLPPSVIKKLGLSFPKMRTNKKYGNVPLDYGTNVIESKDGEMSVRTGSGHEIHSSINETHVGNGENQILPSSSSLSSKVLTKRKKKTDKETRKRMAENIEERLIEKEKPSESEEDADSCEEWERHEAMYDDPDNQERNKERLFEEKIELKWEKGGSGLVFYTDAQYWHEQEGDFDEQTADDWDVDMSAYYEKGAGDKDIRDYITIRQEQQRRNGIEDTDRFTVGFAKKRSIESHYDKLKIGKFEKHTKGFGRKLMEEKGWKDGHGLGKLHGGIPEALENEGQNPRDRSGFGYREENKKYYKQLSKKKNAQREVIISTVYDTPSETDPVEPLLRRHDHYKLKYRDEVLFTKSSKELDAT